ncbi:hypothetical protein [Massilia sp. H6]|uniref:hypothetical protein n=1 Tax=Massilia sp. H6 TaxID=2970464 RepID=UPI0021674874|nr:hypothetical protein [Massilia sp. H6]UVW29020.1 hypothetical protein NRS07_02435 [Massilia sp. H6]
MQLLTMNEISLVSGGDRGDSSVNDAIAGGTAGWHAISRGGALGRGLCALAGAVGMAGSVVLGAAAGYVIYLSLAKYRLLDDR